MKPNEKSKAGVYYERIRTLKVSKNRNVSDNEIQISQMNNRYLRTTKDTTLYEKKLTIYILLQGSSYTF